MDSTIPLENRKGRLFSGWITPALYTALAMFVIGVVYFAIFKPILVLPRITLAPGLVLSNGAGEQISNETYRGRITLYSFSYLNCGGDACAQPLAAIKKSYQVMASLPEVSTPLALATISLDPAEDTAEKLQAMTGLLPAPTANLRWDYLTGDPIRIKHIVGGGFELYYAAKETAEDGRITRFEPRYVLVDGQGLIRAYYHTAEIDPEILARDIRLLDQEQTNSQGLGRIGYEAAHLFVCYP